MGGDRELAQTYRHYLQRSFEDRGKGIAWKGGKSMATFLYYESQLSSMAKLLIANEVRIGGLGGGRLQTDDFEALPHLIRVAMVIDFEADVPGGNWVTVGFDPPWSVLRRAFGVSGMEGKGMQKWSQSITEQWKNSDRVMEKERDWKDKIKGTDWSFGAGCTTGGRLEGQERGLGGLFGSRLYWVSAGKQRSPHSEGCQWLLMFGGEVRGWRCHMIRLEGRKGVAWAGNLE